MGGVPCTFANGRKSKTWKDVDALDGLAADAASLKSDPA
uniref:Uncharacterized protein n=1 Tax=Ralstonia solanacearum TaxID=305 RepID=A0A0S4UG22_RALSL|nr:protein of unknown function [Ralstonia solanacearum]CUV21680.1 protein of unknown function [Ralstonia solanacearum]CUV30627.1 protein of unknown function [Ralstonia solanacearum]CUV32863.1 protein of unknown function [Ralstonia solanacearum]CUV38990.1 protein of unknown function [Ralstonia solanacearum]